MHNFTTVPDTKQLKTLNPKLKAVLFDMDGTLLDTEKLHSEAVEAIIQSTPYQNKLSNYHEICLGNTDLYIFETMKFEHISFNDFIDKKNVFILQALETQRESIISPSILKLLTELKAEGIQIGLVTSSEKSLVKNILTVLNLEEYFDSIITREDTEENKPSPMPYQTMLENLKRKYEEAFILEDSPTGIAAASASKVPYGIANWYLSGLK